jgi:hypothetical protein
MRSGIVCAENFGKKLAQFVNNYLDAGESPYPVDCIFVMAGKQENKFYGVKLWHLNYIEQLITNIGRF